ncbi:MAG: GntR family transcriptional regulator [Phycisphaeraceae bacterium]|nr:GntR family transcriptional regulator [Phycisphaeraceae bacterium]
MKQANHLEPLGHGGYRQAVNRQLLSLMIQSQFPAGHRLILSNLAKQLDVSITPVREAMVDLAALGMVEIRPNRGAVTRAFGPSQLLEIYQLRRILEVEAIRGACGKVSTSMLQELNAQLRDIQNMTKAASSQMAIETDRRLHELIAEHCGSSRLCEEIQRYGILMQAVRDVLGNRNQIQKRAVIEHQQIVQAILANNPQRAAELMTTHIDRTGQQVAAILWPNQKPRHAN